MVEELRRGYEVLLGRPFEKFEADARYEVWYFVDSELLPEHKTHNNIQKYGNTTAATIPICMHEAIELGKIKPGNLVCLVAFGAGLTWGSAFLRF